MHEEFEARHSPPRSHTRKRRCREHGVPSSCAVGAVAKAGKLRPMGYRDALPSGEPRRSQKRPLCRRELRTCRGGLAALHGRIVDEGGAGGDCEAGWAAWAKLARIGSAIAAHQAEHGCGGIGVKW